MKCTVAEKYLKNHDCSHQGFPAEIQKHLTECTDCRHYSRFVAVLSMQKGSLEKAPEEMLPNIERKIVESIRQSKYHEPFFLFRPLFTPSFAGLIIVLIAAGSLLFISQKNIGHVENLSERFKLAQFENIKSGDMLYAGNNTTAAIRLRNNNRFRIHQNTTVKINGTQRIALSRGEISLLSDGVKLSIETPNGLLLARNTTATITTDAKMEKGSLKTSTTCVVFSGNVLLKNGTEEIIIPQGQKFVLMANGKIASRQQLTVAESESGKSTDAPHKLLTAVESLCNYCMYTPEFIPGKKTDHLQLFGKEVNENKHKVRVFWQEIKPLRGTLNEHDKQYSLHGIKTRRIRG